MRYFCILSPFYIMAFLSTAMLKAAMVVSEKKLYAAYVNVALDTGDGDEEIVYVPKFLDVEKVRKTYPRMRMAFIQNDESKHHLSLDELSSATILSILYEAKKAPGNLKGTVQTETEFRFTNDEDKFLSLDKEDFVVYRKKPKGGEKEIKLYQPMSEAERRELIDRAKMTPAEKKKIKDRMKKLKKELKEKYATVNPAPIPVVVNPLLPEPLKDPIEDPLKGKNWKIDWIADHWKSLAACATALGGLLVYWVYKLPGFASPKKVIKKPVSKVTKASAKNKRRPAPPRRR